MKFPLYTLTAALVLGVTPAAFADQSDYHPYTQTHRTTPTVHIPAGSIERIAPHYVQAQRPTINRTRTVRPVRHVTSKPRRTGGHRVVEHHHDHHYPHEYNKHTGGDNTYIYIEKDKERVVERLIPQRVIQKEVVERPVIQVVDRPVRPVYRNNYRNNNYRNYSNRYFRNNNYYNNSYSNRYYNNNYSNRYYNNSYNYGNYYNHYPYYDGGYDTSDTVHYNTGYGYPYYGGGGYKPYSW